MDVYWLLFTLAEALVALGIIGGNVIREAHLTNQTTFRTTAVVPAVGMFIAFVTYRAVAALAWSWTRQATMPESPRSLLLLRVFGHRRRSEQWLDDLGSRWRYLGSIQLIAAPDLAVATLDLPELLDFVRGRLDHRFVTSSADLERRLSTMVRSPDPDGRHRVTEFLCHTDTWQVSMRRLAATADLVLMDLRGFGPSNQGCLYELGALLDDVSLDRIGLMADDTTDRPFLAESLRSRWARLADSSPNRLSKVPVIRVFLVPRNGERRAVRQFIDAFCSADREST